MEREYESILYNQMIIIIIIILFSVFDGFPGDRTPLAVTSLYDHVCTKWLRLCTKQDNNRIE